MLAKHRSTPRHGAALTCACAAHLIWMLAACSNPVIPTQTTQPSSSPAPSALPSATVPSATFTATLTPHPTQTPTASPTASATPPAFQAELVEIVPRLRSDRSVEFATFTEQGIVFAYENADFTIPDTSLYWVAYNPQTGYEASATPAINYDNTFWARNQIEQIANRPEIAGYFSPSGRYVIYNVWFGSVFDAESRTEIWVAEVNGSYRKKISTFGYSNVYIYRAAWFADENYVVFTATYEGPAEFYLADVHAGQTIRLAETADVFGVTEDAWRLSPDGRTLALVDWDDGLKVVSLETGMVTKLADNLAHLPTWSADGQRVYYWWGNESFTAERPTDLRYFDLATNSTVTLIDRPSLNVAFHGYEGDDVNVSREYYLGSAYAVSPAGDQILLWGPSLHWLTLPMVDNPVAPN